jgi:hypothetical protein
VTGREGAGLLRPRRASPRKLESISGFLCIDPARPADNFVSEFTSLAVMTILFSGQSLSPLQFQERPFISANVCRESN